jgi:hypothetical protein
MFEQKYIDRFHTKYHKAPSGCWEWNAGKDIDGYGRYNISTGPKKWTNVFAHRFSWLVANQTEWPKDKPVARHTCNNPGCVNPDHIIPGTQKENIADCYSAGRQSQNYDTIGQQVQCPHCDKTGGLGVMKRWHFENCKQKDLQ